MRSETAVLEIHERVRWADVDSAGNLYFAAYTRFMDVAESELFRSSGYPYRTLSELDIILPRVHVEFDFFRPALLDDELTLRTRVGGVGVHSIRLHVEVSRAAETALLAEATMVTACVNRARKSVPLPDGLAAALRAQITPG
ncbi:MAG: acyl-CoA thioesterase [Candidatus Eremiobacteraeota bacterium]|nr:acyl-CoA thioesterase [Candidatus Eremiobacteraeota bacterium]